MKNLTNTTLIASALLAGLFMLPGAAFAQGMGEMDESDTTDMETNTEVDESKTPTDDDTTKKAMGRKTDLDPQPKAPRPEVLEDGEMAKQAGVGGAIAYGEAGVLELGGSAGFSINNSFRNATFSPTIGWFLADNFQVSALLNTQYVGTNLDGNTTNGFSVAALLEPSYHFPFTNTIYAFAGLGAGLAYIKDIGAGFALQPRLGMNFLIGRSGILTPALNVGYSTVDAATANGRTLLTVEPSFGMQLGYTIMW